MSSDQKDPLAQLLSGWPWRVALLVGLALVLIPCVFDGVTQLTSFPFIDLSHIALRTDVWNLGTLTCLALLVIVVFAPVVPAIWNLRAGAVRKTNRPPAASAASVKIRFFNPIAIDVSAIDEALISHGFNWPTVEIEWSQAVNAALRGVEDCLVEANNWPDFQGRSEFLSSAPEAIAQAKAGRANAPARIQGYVRRLHGLPLKQAAQAIKSFLVLLSFEVHHGVSRQLGWKYLNEKGYTIPEFWRGILFEPVWRCTAKLLGPDDFGGSSFAGVSKANVASAKVERVGDFDVVARPLIYAPHWQLARTHKNMNTDSDFITKWLVPQLGLETSKSTESLRGEWLIYDVEVRGALE